MLEVDEIHPPSILILMKYKREFELTVNFKTDSQLNLTLLENPIYETINLNDPKNFK
jgi:hypothetical protein